MGLSASQCRYLMLSARKSDVEFQGQQINQQRTNLANQSSALYSDLISLDVPTPPSSSDYTKTSYVFNMGNTSCDISSVKYNSDGTYNVNYSNNTTGAKAETAQAYYTRLEDGTFARGSEATGVTPLNAVSGLDPSSPEYLEITSNLALIYGPDWATSGEEYYFSQSDGAYQFINQSQLATLPTPGSSVLNYSYVNQNATIQLVSTLENCAINWSNSGRMESIDFYDPATGITTNFQLDCTTTTDNYAYNDAMQEYNYQQQIYENQQNAVNAKLQIVQSQDKELELQLQNLDTTQKAISTEIDSVKKVIDKNVETSFKTFA